MRHYKKGRKLGTSKAHTKAMKRSLVTALFENDRIKTIEARAKEIRPDVDKIITWAKKGDLHSRRLAIAALGGNKELVREIFEKVEQGMFKDRKGGYTRIMKLGYRKGDNAPIVIMELVSERVSKKKSASGAGKAGSGAGAGVSKVGTSAKASAGKAGTDKASAGSGEKSQKAKSSKSSEAKADEVEENSTDTVDATEASAQADEIVVEGEEVVEVSDTAETDDEAGAEEKAESSEDDADEKEDVEADAGESESNAGADEKAE